jgi:hypothetical protein
MARSRPLRPPVLLAEPLAGLVRLHSRKSRRNQLEAYRLRWQIELQFKRWKSLCGFDRLPNYRDDTIVAWLYAKVLIGVLLDRMSSIRDELSPPVQMEAQGQRLGTLNSESRMDIAYLLLVGLLRNTPSNCRGERAHTSRARSASPPAVPRVTGGRRRMRRIIKQVLAPVVPSSGGESWSKGRARAIVRRFQVSNATHNKASRVNIACVLRVGLPRNIAKVSERSSGRAKACGVDSASCGLDSAPPQPPGQAFARRERSLASQGDRRDTVPDGARLTRRMGNVLALRVRVRLERTACTD